MFKKIIENNTPADLSYHVHFGLKFTANIDWTRLDKNIKFKHTVMSLKALNAVD